MREQLRKRRRNLSTRNTITVRKRQESVELALKGLLRFVGIEYSKSHRVGAVLLESCLRDEVPVDVLKKVAEISDELAREREPAFYGTEEGAAEELFTESDAGDALKNGNNGEKMDEKQKMEYQTVVI